MNMSKKKLVKSIVLSAVVFGVLGAAVVASAGVKDFYIQPHNGVVSVAQVSVATRKGYKGVNPKIRNINSIGFPHCKESRFQYGNELIRVTFNCTEGRTVLSPATR